MQDAYGALCEAVSAARGEVSSWWGYGAQFPEQTYGDGGGIVMAADAVTGIEYTLFPVDGGDVDVFPLPWRLPRCGGSCHLRSESAVSPCSSP